MGRRQLATVLNVGPLSGKPRISRIIKKITRGGRGERYGNLHVKARACLWKISKGTRKRYLSLVLWTSVVSTMFSLIFFPDLEFSPELNKNTSGMGHFSL